MQKRQQRSEATAEPRVDGGQFVGQRVAKHWEGLGWFHGTVSSSELDEDGRRIWRVNFDDGDSEDFHRDELNHIIARLKPGGEDLPGEDLPGIATSATDHEHEGPPTIAGRAAVSERRNKKSSMAKQFTSAFVGVSWNKQRGRWQACIQHDGSKHGLGYFETDQEAARAFDAAARRLRPKGQAHGGHSGAHHWHRLNFPTIQEEACATQQGMLLAAEAKTAAVAKAAAQGFASKFVGVSWRKESGRWKALINHHGRGQSLGSFANEEQAARAYDEAARRLRPKGQAHGGRANHAHGKPRWWHRLNFPTSKEQAYAAQQGMPSAEGKSAAAASAAAQDFSSEFIGARWTKDTSRWRAHISHNGKNHCLGAFANEEQAARAYDEAARRLRPKGQAHGVRTGARSDGSGGHWARLNFPTAAETAFAKAEAGDAAPEAEVKE